MSAAKMIYFIAFFFLSFAVLAWKRLDWALMFLLAALPAYVIRFQVGPLPSTVLEGMILIAFAVWFLKHTRFKDFLRGEYRVRDFLKNSPFSKKGSKEARRKYPFGAEIVLMLLVSLAAVAISGFTADALGIWKAYFFEPALLFVMVLNVFQGRKDIERMTWALGCGALAVASWAIIQKMTGLGIDNPLWAAEATRRSVSFFGYPNAVGLYLAPIMMLLLGVIAASHQENHPFLSAYPGKFFKEEYNWKNSKTKAFLAFIAVISALAIYYAKSDGAIAALAAALFVVGLLGNKRTRLVALALAVVAVLALVIVPGAYKKVGDKLALRDFSGQVRVAQWSETWKMLKDGRLIVGSGLSGYQKAIEPYHIPGIFYDDGTDPEFHRHVVWNDEYKKKVWRPVEIYLYPHNIVFNFWTELGLLGLLLFVWIFGKAFKLAIGNWQLAIKNKDSSAKFLSLGMFGALVVIVVHGLVDVPYFKNDLAVLFWVLIAILSLLSLRQKNPSTE
jgi:O-antigen ligase